MNLDGSLLQYIETNLFSNQCFRKQKSQYDYLDVNFYVCLFHSIETTWTTPPIQDLKTLENSEMDITIHKNTKIVSDGGTKTCTTVNY